VLFFGSSCAVFGEEVGWINWFKIVEEELMYFCG
jgi:hypothetical protein